MPSGLLGTNPSRLTTDRRMKIEEPSPLDPFRLQRFHLAQEPVYGHVIAELRDGRKETHWIWFVFPQLAGLGHSEMARTYGILSVEEASAYLQHPVLGQRLLECAEAVLAVPDRTAREILGSPDDLKLRSCATLFAAISHADSVFHRVLDHFFGSGPDPKTLELLALKQ